MFFRLGGATEKAVPKTESNSDIWLVEKKYRDFDSLTVPAVLKNNILIGRLNNEKKILHSLDSKGSRDSRGGRGSRDNN